MGQSSSKSIHAKSGRRRSLKSPLLRKSKSNLSHTFSIPATNDNIELVNINYASEEQLMTLSGITRQLAQAIVEHRQVIGRFKRIDDLALVSGMGAEKLNTIRTEICVGRRLASNPNSRAQSLDSIGSLESVKTPTDVNTANVFQLQCIQGLNQELAANIVDHRIRKGLFKSLDELIKVKGINTIRLSSIKCHLSLNHDEGSHKTLTSINHQGNWTNGALSMHDSKSALSNGTHSISKIPGHGKSSAISVKCANLSNGFSAAPVNDIFDLLSAYSRRPIVEDEFIYYRDGKPAFRLATWNLHQLTCEKANNPGFKEVVCLTILENKFSILGIQEVLEEEALSIICNELNSPSLRRVCEWKENSRKWLYQITPSLTVIGQYFGTIYDEFSVNIHVQIHPIKQKTEENDLMPEDSTNKEKMFDLGQYSNLNYSIIDCKVNNTHILLANIYIAEEFEPECSKTLLCEMIDKFLVKRKNLIIFGDFHSKKNLKDLALCYKSVIDPTCSTRVDMLGEAGQGGGGRAGLLLPEGLKIYSNRSGIVRNGLNHLAIPHGWTWGGPASPHCPIWAEFFIPLPDVNSL